MDRAARTSQRRMRDIERSAKRLGVAMAAAFSAAVATAGFQIRSVLNQADEIGKMSERIGVSVEALSGLRFAAELSGTSINSLQTAVQRLSANMADTAKGTGEAQDAFRALGIEVADTAGSLRSNEEVLRDVADRFARMEDGAAKTALAMRLFGRSGAELIPFLNQGRDGLEAMQQEAERLGIVMSRDLTDAAQRVNDNFTRLGKIWQGAWVQAVSASIGALEDLQAILLDPTTRRAIEDLVNGMVRGFTQVTAVITNTVNFMRWLGEEVAAQRFGVAADDIVRLQQRLDTLNVRIEAIQSRRDSWRGAIGLDPTMERRQQELIEERDAVQVLIDSYDDLASTVRQVAPPTMEGAAPFIPLDLFDELETSQRAVRDRVSETIAALTREAETFGQSRAEIMAYDLALMGATETQIGLATALADQIEGQARMKQMMEDGKRVFEQTRTPAEALSNEIERLNMLLEAGAIEGGWDTYARAIFAAQERFDEMRTVAASMAEEVDQVNDLGASIGMSFASGFEEAIVSGGRFRDVLQGILDDLLRIATRTLITAPLADAAGSFFSGMFPARASGGPVSAGSGYIVGERGPELFVPRTGGNIVPNHAMGGSVQVNVINNVGAEVRTNVTEGAHGTSIDVMIDRAVAEKLADRGSDSSRSLRAAFGAKTTLTGR